MAVIAGPLPGGRGADHVGLTVADLDEAVAFFVGVLGFEVVYAHAPEHRRGAAQTAQFDRHPDTEIRGITMLRLGNLNLELLAFAAPDQRRTPGRTSDVGAAHIALYVDDLEAAIDRLRAHAVRVLGTPMPLPGPERGEGNAFVFALGPGGIVVELITYPGGKAHERGQPPRRAASGAPGVALVTGASSGIGRAFAHELATRGDRVVLVARGRERLAAVADALPGTGHEVLAADLATAAGCDAVARRIEDDREPVTLLVNAAGVGTADAFPRVALADEERQLDVNVRATLRLCWTASHAMRRRRAGSIVTIASTAAIWSAGTYAGSKAWVVTATEGLRTALAGSPVRVLCVIPGFTRSEFHQRAGVDNTRVRSWLWLAPERVAREALAALAADRGVCVPSRRYRLIVAALRPLPAGGRRAVLRRLAPLAPSGRRQVTSG